MTLAFITMPGGWEWIAIAVVALLLFGRRLPEVGRGIGKGIVEFRKGLKGIEDEIEAESSKPSTPRTLPEQTATQAPIEAERRVSRDDVVTQ